MHLHQLTGNPIQSQIVYVEERFLLSYVRFYLPGVQRMRSNYL